MSYLLAQLVNGLSYGLVIGLIAVGFALVFTSTGVLNFAHGSIVLLGTYVTARFQADLGFIAALGLGIVVAAVVGILINRFLVENLADPTPATAAILMLGVDAILLTELVHLIGNNVLPLGAPWGADVTQIGGAAVPTSRLIGAGVAVVALVLLWLLLTRSSAGVQMRAAASDGETAGLMGIHVRRTSGTTWAMSGALATIAGIFLASFPSPGVAPTLSLSALAAIPAWVIGGFDSVPGAVVGGLLVGVVSALATGYETELFFLGRGFGEVVPYAAMILVLLFRPTGLFGREEVHRV